MLPPATGVLLGVHMSAPIQVSFRIDMQRILASGFRVWEQAWRAGTPLARTGWSPVMPSRRENSLMFDVDGLAGSGLVPWIGRIAHDEVAKTVDPLLSSVGLRATSAELVVFDFGVAVYRLGTTAEGDISNDLATLVGPIEQVSTRVAEAIGPWTKAKLAELKEAIPTDLLVPQSLEGAPSISETDGLPLWMHRVLEVESLSDGQQEETLQCIRQGEYVECGRGRPAHLWVGHGTSLLDVPADDAPAVIRELAEVLDSANAYFAGCQQLGTVVLRRQQELAHFRRLNNARAMRAQTHHLVELHDELSLYRTLIHEYLANCDISGRRMAEAIFRSWRLDSMLDEIEHRRQDLGDIHDQALRRAQADEASRLNWVVFGLTMISAAEVITALIDFVQAQGMSSPDSIRTLVVAVVVAILAVVAWRAAKAASSTPPRISAEELDVDPWFEEETR